MEFHEKLQELRRKKGLTQEELAESLFVSRTAISRWESGRGYPNIDSLKATARFFGVTVDELLSGDELLTLAEEDTKQQQTHVRDLVFGLLDCSVGLFFFLPLFGQKIGDTIQAVPLLSLTEIAPYLKSAYLAIAASIILWGILTLALQNCQNPLWLGCKQKLTLALNVAGTLLFMVSLQPYAAAFLFIFLAIKVIMLLKRH